MHRSSETIGKIAAALALAQRQLQNPEKSQSATLPGSATGEEARSFRYASLASGLDIIRKALGEHEIATVQSTSLDKDLGLIRLNTVLAHSSGEWIASDWPVCATSDVASPQRLGSYLTYARRYALFTIVGIAGEDDLDASDLDNRKSSTPRSPATSSGSNVTALSPNRSEGLRDQLLAEVAPLRSLDDLTVWALRRLRCKNSLRETDAEIAKLQAAESSKGNGVTTAASQGATPTEISPAESGLDRQKTVRRRSKPHLLFVATQKCMVCKRTPCDAHHLRFAQPRALGRKVSDEYTVPLCREHHSELHRQGNERAWWVNAGLAPLELASVLWDASQRREAEAGRATTTRVAKPA